MRTFFPGNSSVARIPLPAGILLFLVVGVVSLLPAQQSEVPDPQVSLHLEWISRTAYLDIQTVVPASGINLPAARYRAEQYVVQNLPRLLLKAFEEFPVSSRYRLRDLLHSRPEMIRSIRDLVEKRKKVTARLSRDLKRLDIRYAFSLYPDIAGILVTHSRPYPPPRIIDYVPTTDFSGVVIYAKGKLPVHGEEEVASIVPSMFPQLYDEGMNLILSQGMVSPDVILSRGMISYSDSQDVSAYQNLVGEKPLFIVAERLFGKTPSDIVIPREDAARLLASEHNRALLTSGRILVLYDTQPE